MIITDGEPGRCVCGNRLVSVICANNKVTVLCPQCYRQTTRRTREEAVAAWDERRRKADVKSF